MAGPVVRILVQASALPVEPAIAESFESVGLRPDEGELPEYYPKARDRYDLPYDVEVEPSDPELDEEIAAALEPDGFRLSHGVLLIAYVNDDRAHRVLGEFAADLAERTEGWIDVGGPLRPRSWHPVDTPPAKYRRYLAKLGLPGEVRLAEYETAPGGRLALRELLDAEAMRAWLRHRDFHMLK
jgi:hypothetical protein